MGPYNSTESYFQVPMHDSVGVQEVERPEQDHHEVSGFVLRVVLQRHHAVKQLPAHHLGAPEL